ncbi:hypothetical protein JCM4914_58260 [Streptomyces platensis subsp. malvinus]
MTSTTARRSDTVASGSKLAFSTSVSRIPSTSRTRSAPAAKLLHCAAAGIPRTTQFPHATREMADEHEMKTGWSGDGTQARIRTGRDRPERSALRVPPP